MFYMTDGDCGNMAFVGGSFINLKGNNMYLIAYGLAVHHPAAYTLVFVLLYPPAFIIGFWIFDKLKEWWTKRR